MTTQAELEISRVYGTQEVARIRIRAGGRVIAQVAMPLEEYAKATMGQLVRCELEKGKCDADLV